VTDPHTDEHTCDTPKTVFFSTRPVLVSRDR